MSRDLAEVSPGVWVATAAIWTSNTTVVVDDDGGALVIDPGITRTELDSLADAIHGRGWRVVAGLSTHPHWDHVLWALSLGDVPRFASPAAIAALASDVERCWAEASSVDPAHDRALFGALTPIGRLAGAPVGTEVPLGLPAPHHCHVVSHRAHAPGHVALVARGVLVAGDMLSDVEVPLLDVGPGRDAARAPADPLADYEQALDVLERAVAVHDVDVLVPGHGTVAVGRPAVRRRFEADRAYLRELRAASAGRPGRGQAPMADPRLADAWVAGEHAAQAAFLGARHG